MNKNCKLTIGAMLLLTTAFSVAEVRAQTCVVPPTCEGLGYDKTASDCGGLAKLRCPFDDSKYFCTAYLNPDGSSPATVGDIVYSDGTYSSPEFNYPTKHLSESFFPIMVVILWLWMILGVLHIPQTYLVQDIQPALKIGVSQQKRN